MKVHFKPQQPTIKPHHEYVRLFGIFELIQQLHNLPKKKKKKNSGEMSSNAIHNDIFITAGHFLCLPGLTVNPFLIW